jgi:hypothetical protein
MARTVTGKTSRPGIDLDADLTDPGTFPDMTAFWESRPMLTHLHKLARARRVAPGGLLGAVMAQAVAATSHLLVLPPIVGGIGSLNIAVGLVGAPGAGKGAVMAVAGEVMPVTVNEVGVGSGEGLAHVYARRNRKKEVERIADSALVYIPEIDSLRGVAHRQGATIMPELRKAWSGEGLGFTYADPAKRLPIEAHSYRLAIVAGIQPGRAGVLLDDQDAGTPQRFLWLPATDPDAPDERPRKPRTQRIEHLAEDVTGIPSQTVMDVASAIQDEVDADRLARLRGEAADPLGGHAMYSKLKVAAALAIISNDPGKITDEDWELAGQVMQVSDYTRQLVVEETRSAIQAQIRARGEADATRASMIEGRLESDKIKRAIDVMVNRARKLVDEGQEYVSYRDLKDATGRYREYFSQALEIAIDSAVLVKHGRQYRLP